MIYHIVAVDKNGGIGKDNGLPWKHNKSDMRLFKTLTMGKTVIMGRNTWESLPDRKLKYSTTKALQGRSNVVVSYSMAGKLEYQLNKHQGVYITKDLSIITQECPLLSDERFVIGGESLYTQTMDMVDMIYLTRIDDEYECDTFYPIDQLDSFDLISSIKYDSFTLEVYKR
jgi:dihydrofolate reductase